MNPRMVMKLNNNDLLALNTWLVLQAKLSFSIENLIKINIDRLESF